jgi:hypothetical protein
MNLYDTRLDFARCLVRHWIDLRGGALLPLEADIDPNELAPICDSLGILDLRLPSRLGFELAGERVRKRFGRDVDQVNWLDLVPPALAEPGKIAREHARTLPCAYYRRFTVSRGDAPAVMTEALVLPLRRRIAAIPDAAIGVIHDYTADGTDAPAGWLTPSARVAEFFDELIDIEYPFVMLGWRCAAFIPPLRKSSPVGSATKK